MDDNDDDLSSGWSEVKKKHRKFSFQGLVGEASGKGRPSAERGSSSFSVRNANTHPKQKYHAPKVGLDSNSQVKLDGGKSKTTLKEEKMAQPCLDKCIVSENTECTTNVTNSVSTNGPNEKFLVDTWKEKSDTSPRIPKIKWGDLEDDVLLLSHDNLDETETRFVDLGDDNLLMHQNTGASDELKSSDSCADIQEDKVVVTLADAEQPPSELCPLVPVDISYNGDSEEINTSCSKDVDLLCEDEKVLPPKDPCPNESCEACVKLMDNDIREELHINSPDLENSLSTIVKEVGMVTESQGHCDKSQDDFVTISEIPVNDCITTIVLGDHIIPPVQNVVLEPSDDVSVSENQNRSQDGKIDTHNTNAQNMDVLEEGESSESKERFRQRLWCFLFENLNRAIDELYLLCELECDLEQMKEAILVLEEAGSDFKELKSRVEGFDIVKRPSSQPFDGVMVNSKIDHRRPHALSWEVRRMAASPHRAEILSSSLEAFKKIHKERSGLFRDHDINTLGPCVDNHLSGDLQEKSVGGNDVPSTVQETTTNSKKQTDVSDNGQVKAKGDKKNMDGRRSSKALSSSTHDSTASHVSLKTKSAVAVAAKCRREPNGPASEPENHVVKKDKATTDGRTEKNPKYMDPLKRQSPLSEKEKGKGRRDSDSWRSLDAWKEKRNWEDILSSSLRPSSRVSHSPGMSRKSMERARVLRDKLMSPEKKKKTAVDLKKDAEEKHARATRIRSEFENERLQKLQRTSEKLVRVNEWQAVRSVKLKEEMHARQQRSESRHEAYLAQVVRRAGDESSKVNEVRFITSMNEENKKHILRQKHHESELRRAERLQIIKIKQKEDIAREEAVLERRKLRQAEKLQRHADIQRKKEEALVRREEERKASSAAREARAIEQLRRKEIRAKIQQEEAELLAQKLAERLRESEQRRKFYLEQIRERASMDFRDQTSPLLRRSSNKDSIVKSTSTNNAEEYQATNISGLGGSLLGNGDTALQHSLKRRIKKIRQRLMALKHEFTEPPISAENAGTGYRSLVGTARAKIGRWLQELQRFRQARKEGASSIGLIVIDMIKFLEGKEPELHASRQAGLVDFIASALPASHMSKPEACQVTIYLLRLLKVVLSLPANRSYFVAHNLLPPLIPMLSAALENYIKIAASVNVPGSTNTLSSKTSVENFDSVSEVLEGFIWTVTTIIGHICSDERQVQMKDFLLELVIAYQVIHRLRELFALQDRPQVEGSSFPPPIILSLNMLVVLTSRPATVSFIDWDSCSSIRSNESQEMKRAKSVEFGNSSINVCDAVLSSHLSESHDIGDASPSDGPEKERADVSVELTYASPLEMHITVLSGQKNENVKQPAAILLSVIAETGLVSLPSLLTAVLLQANNRLSSEQGTYVLPSNFEEVATGVLKVLNNLALLDITLMQTLLARTDLQMEFFHLMSFLLSHCTSKWKSATDQVGLLLLESLLLLGYFALFHPGNQAVLRWGKGPTILHKVCDLPFVFFSDPELMPILAGTLVSACYGCEQNRGVVQQELSTDMLLSLVSSCRSVTLGNPLHVDNTIVHDQCEASQLGNELKKFQVELPVRSTRYNSKSSRLSLGKGGASGTIARAIKTRGQKDVKFTKTCEDWALKHNLPSSGNSTFMLHSRFPPSFVDRVEEFFSVDVSSFSGI